MIATVKEASEIACPQAGQNFPNVKCRGPGCFAWRWWHDKDPLRDPNMEKRYGYCGMAGRPSYPS
jgi:hypothetical protein